MFLDTIKFINEQDNNEESSIEDVLYREDISLEQVLEQDIKAAKQHAIELVEDSEIRIADSVIKKIKEFSDDDYNTFSNINKWLKTLSRDKKKGFDEKLQGLFEIYKSVDEVNDEFIKMREANLIEKAPEIKSKEDSEDEEEDKKEDNKSDRIFYLMFHDWSYTDAEQAESIKDQFEKYIEKETKLDFEQDVEVNEDDGDNYDLAYIKIKNTDKSTITDIVKKFRDNVQKIGKEDFEKLTQGEEGETFYLAIDEWQDKMKEEFTEYIKNKSEINFEQDVTINVSNFDNNLVFVKIENAPENEVNKFLRQYRDQIGVLDEDDYKENVEYKSEQDEEQEQQSDDDEEETSSNKDVKYFIVKQEKAEDFVKLVEQDEDMEANHFEIKKDKDDNFIVKIDTSKSDKQDLASVHFAHIETELGEEAINELDENEYKKHTNKGDLEDVNLKDKQKEEDSEDEEEDPGPEDKEQAKKNAEQLLKALKDILRILKDNPAAGENIDHLYALLDNVIEADDPQLISEALKEYKTFNYIIKRIWDSVKNKYEKTEPEFEKDIKDLDVSKVTDLYRTLSFYQSLAKKFSKLVELNNDNNVNEQQDDSKLSELKNNADNLDEKTNELLDEIQSKIDEQVDKSLDNAKDVEISEFVELVTKLVELIDNKVLTSETENKAKQKIKSFADSYGRDSLKEQANKAIKKRVDNAIQSFENLKPNNEQELNNIYDSLSRDIKDLESKNIISSDDASEFQQRLDKIKQSKNKKFYQTGGYSKGIKYDKVFTLILDKEITVTFDKEGKKDQAEDIPNWIKAAYELVGYDMEPGAQSVVNSYKHLRKAVWDWSGDGLLRRANTEKAPGKFAEFRRKVANFMIESVDAGVGGGMHGGTGMDLGNVGSSGGTTPGTSHQVPGTTTGMGDVEMPDSSGKKGSGDIPSGSKRSNKNKGKKRKKVKSTNRDKKYSKSSRTNTFNFKDFLKVKNQYN